MSGFGTELGIVNILFLVGLVFKLFIIPWYKAKKELARAEKNPGPQIETQKITANNIRVPGASKICRENRENITKICTNVKNLRDEIRIQNQLNEKDHDKMWKRLEEIRDKI